jgi:hypothetical protein
MSQGTEDFRGDTVRTSALASPNDCPAPAITLTMAMVSEPVDRRLIRGATFSVLLHLALLLTLRTWWLDATASRSVPGSALQMYLRDGPVTEYDEGAERKYAVVSDPHAGDELQVVATPHRVTDTDSLHDMALSPAAAPSDAPAGEPAQADALPGNQPTSLEDPAALSTVDDDAPQAPMLIDSAPDERLQLAMSASQRSMLARRITKLAQGLRDSDPTRASQSWRHGGRRYTAVLTRQPVAGQTDIERVVVEVSTEDAGQRFRTQLQMQRLAFSQFAQLVDNWDADVQFHADEIAGRFHSNSAITVGYDRHIAPRFLGQVTTSAGAVAIGNSSGPRRIGELFPAGIETLASRIALPKAFQSFVCDQGSKDAKVRTFAGDTRITFYPDGSYGWQALGADSPEQREALSSAPFYLAGGPKSSVHVRGTVNGSVMVCSPQRIVIDGNLVYAHDPRSAPDASDYVALVSDRDIEIARPLVTGPGDLRIDGAMYARGRFIVTDESARGDATLFIYGSLTAGSMSATEPRYATRIEFDPRFDHVRPPGFPMTNNYEIEAWDGNWERVESDPPE